MKRRGFLTLLGAAITAPAIPGAAPALGARLKTLGMAHARKFPMVSVMGMSRRLDLSTEEAKELFAYLSRKGVIGAPNVPGTGLANAASRVFRPVPVSVKVDYSRRTAQQAKTPETNARTPAQTPRIETDHRSWLTHLHDLCRQNGLTLSPRAQALVA